MSRADLTRIQLVDDILKIWRVMCLVQMKAAMPKVLNEARVAMAGLLKAIKAHETNRRRGKVIIR